MKNVNLSILVTLIFASALPAVAQGVASSGASGDQSHTSSKTGQGANGTPGSITAQTSNQQRVDLQTTMKGLAPVFGGGAGSRNGLPPTRLDSFVHEAAGNAELIYGDEGAEGLPPYESFTYDHRINNGIYGERDSGLTTGHGSQMPSAWGNDEFLGAEWSKSGSSGN